jgi:hypothetical protein
VQVSIGCVETGESQEQSGWVVDRLLAFACGPNETAGPRSTSLRAGSPLRYPGFPVQLIGVDELRAAFLTESRIRRLGRYRVVGIRVRSSSTARRDRRDDKVEGGGPPWHEWRWMDRVDRKLIWTRLNFRKVRPDLRRDDPCRNVRTKRNMRTKFRPALIPH